MTENLATVQRYMETYAAGDRPGVLSCLTDDVEWDIPGMPRIAGRDAFSREIDNPAFTGLPVITVQRMFESGDLVVAEGAVLARPAAGGTLRLRFCDVFEMRSGRIARLISYLMPAGAPGA